MPEEEEDQHFEDLESQEEDDDFINEGLFERYDKMFTHYNAFGAMF